MSLVLLLALPFAGALCAACLPARARNAESWLAGGVALAGAVQTLLLFPRVAAGGVLQARWTWLPEYGLDFVLRMDGFAWLFSMLVTGIGALVVLYARYYMSPQDPVARFFSFFLAFMGAMQGIVLSGNLIQLALFWELTSLVSFMLIAYWHHRDDARRGARMALTVTAAGGLALLAGMLVLGHIAGTYDLDRVLQAGPAIRAHPWYGAAVALIALGALTKSAQFPFHFWLPHAMAAPTPVSAYLHSATMVKAGVFLLARLWPVLAGTETWFWVVGGAGVCTLVLGTYAAMFQQDLKGVLAYSTIGHLGLITLLLGMNSPLATVAAIFHIVNHATFKASLFMAAGIVDHETGTRDMRRLSGLRAAMPVTATLATVASAAMAGVPLLNGFLSKEMFFTETVFVGGAPWLRVALPLAATLAGLFSVVYSLRFIHQVFFGPPAADLPRQPHEPPHWMRFPVELLVVACLVVGMVPALTVGPFLASAAGAVLGASLPDYDLAVWHGATPALGMSLVAMLGGVACYARVRRLRLSADEEAPGIRRLDGRRTFDRVLSALDVAADRVLEACGSQRLQPQLLLLVCAAVAAGLLPLAAGPAWTPRGGQAADPAFALLWALGAACALAAAVQAKYHRLAALMLLGATGLAVCLTFAWFSAPDLALTQMAVEIVTTILLLLGLRWLPKRMPPEAGTAGAAAPAAVLRRGRDIAIAAGAGAGMSALSYLVLTLPPGQSIASYFLTHALTYGGGTNVVNVILVDFRAFDTLGEITVLGAVALTVYALLRRFRPAEESMELPAQQRGQEAADPAERKDAVLPAGPLALPAVLARLLLPMAGLVSAFFLLRGHNEPGGGFVAGLVMATAVVLQYMVGGVAWVESRTRIHPQSWIALGLLCCALTAMGAWLVARPFLTAGMVHLRLPVIGDIHLASALLFDLGVYMLVVGATILVLVALAHQSLRSHRREAPAPGRGVY